MVIPMRTASQVPVIDRNAHRAQLAVSGALMLTSGVSGWAWPLWIGAIVFATSAARFPETSPIVRIWNETGARFRPPRLLIDARPARVMVSSTVPTMAGPRFPTRDNAGAVGAPPAPRPRNGLDGRSLRRPMCHLRDLSVARHTPCRPPEAAARGRLCHLHDVTFASARSRSLEASCQLSPTTRRRIP